jgi:hypothetical protein
MANNNDSLAHSTGNEGGRLHVRSLFFSLR